MKRWFKLKIDLFIAATSLFSWIAIGTIVFHRLESWNWIQSFYFSVVTISTVGFGDFTPSNDLCRLFTAIYILIGVSIAIVTMSIIGSEILRKRVNLISKRKNYFDKKD